MNEPRPDINEQARDKWAGILPLLGVDSSILDGKHRPCPVCNEQRNRFRFDDKEGRGTWICTCGAGSGMDLAMAVTGLSFAETAARIRAVLGEVRETTKRKPSIDLAAARAGCFDLWKGAVPIYDDQAAAYLRSRGFNGPYSSELRFHPAAEVNGHPTRRTLPALLARVSTAKQGVNLHRTYLENGAKAVWTEPGEKEPASCRRLMPGGLPTDAAIRLAPHEGKLGVAEGIETAMAAMRDFGIPCWALINTSQMARWAFPDDIQELHIFGDHDRKFGGQMAAFTLAHRAACKGLTVVPHIPGFSIDPSFVGTDWADARQLEAA